MRKNGRVAFIYERRKTIVYLFSEKEHLLKKRNVNDYGRIKTVPGGTFRRGLA